MDSVKTALFKRHSNYNISVDEIGMKLDFVWAPYVLNLTHLLTDFKIKKKYPDVMVMGAGLWHMLHVSNPSDYELVLQTLKSSLVSLFPFSADIANAYAEVVVMLVTTALVTLVMLLIWQTNLLMALCFPLLIGSIKLIYFSAVLSKHYGSVLKYQSEVREKISMDFMIELGSKLGTVRVPGIDLLYNELVHGIPSIFGQFLLSLPAIHFTIIFVCIKYVPVPVVPQEERFLFRRVGPKDYHIFKCIARYENFLLKEAQDLALESRLHEMDIDSVFVSSKDHRNRDVPGNKELKIPLMRERRSEEAISCILKKAPASLPSSVMSSDEDLGLEYELSALRQAIDSGFTYFLAHGDVRAKKNILFLKKLVINYFYAFLQRNCRVGAANMSVPHMNILQVGMTYMV
uniref:K+ potassium transporter C-terminal domain-containing protein n=1 Tax=Gossypium raimondii TaxID=29730 RepID=A0A0D2RK70_GOSRA|nr:hypothetical protein B456_011G105200 [Gossypium raimondii]